MFLQASEFIVIQIQTYIQQVLEKLSRHVTGLVLVILEACTSDRALASAWRKKSFAQVRLNFIKPEELISAKIVGRNVNICYFKIPLFLPFVNNMTL